MSSAVETETISTKIPARMDRLPWSPFHWRVVAGLGTVWLLDGLEVTMVGSVAARLTDEGSGIQITPGQIGIAAAVYIVGAVTGALFFGQLTDRFGRKKLFIITLVVYIAATVATAFAFAPWYFYLARFVTGTGIGGEYAAINSAIDELIPARARGRIDLVINGTYWLGAAGGSAMALLLLNESLFPTDVGWRLAFAFGAVLGLVIMLVRRTVPESPRWLFIHGREQEAEQIVGGIEHDVGEQTGQQLEDVDESITVRQRTTIPFRMIARTAFSLYPQRAVLGFALFIGQAFLYNGMTFNLGTLFNTFYEVPSGTVPLLIIFWSLGNFAGPVVLGRFFDTVGRKPMIAGCYLGSAVLTVPLIVIFVQGTVNQWGFLVNLVVIFFLASAAASAAYLTVSEVFPMETRALAIAFFYAVGTGAGGIIGPVLFGQLIGTGDRDIMAIAFIVSALVMAGGGITELIVGVPAEQANLENIAKPLTAREAEEESGGPEEGGSEADRYRRTAEQRREEAERARAAAADHRAGALEDDLDPAARSADGGEAADGRRRVDETLAEASELQAQALDEQAASYDELAAAEEAPDEHAAAAARARAQAADQRAQGLSEQAEALGARRDREADGYEARAAAAGERARAREQRALAEEARGAAQPDSEQPDVNQARASMHDAWAEMHDARAEVELARSAGDQAAARDNERLAAEAERRALAAEERVGAEEHRGAAAGLQEDREAAEESEAEQRRSRQRAQDRLQRAEELEQRIRDRVSTRMRRERAGLRRLRPGPGRTLQAGRSGGLDPRVLTTTEQALDREISAIARAVDEQGPTDRSDLARLVGARYWGPGRFGEALRAAVEEGRVRRVSRRTYGPPE